jgi:hypothetical protein
VLELLRSCLCILRDPVLQEKRGDAENGRAHKRQGIHGESTATLHIGFRCSFFRFFGLCMARQVEVACPGATSVRYLLLHKLFMSQNLFRRRREGTFDTADP